MSLYKSPYTVCSVFDCTSRISYRNKSEFYEFPKKVTSEGRNELLQRWIDALKITKKLTGQMKVCKRHFKDEDFIQQGDQKVLKSDAVPSQSLPNVWRNKFHPRDYGKLIKLLEMRGIGRLRLCFEAKLGRRIRKSLHVGRKSNKTKKQLKTNGKSVTTNALVKTNNTDDVMLVPNIGESGASESSVPAPLPQAQADPFTSEIDIKDEPFSDHEETIEEMLAKMNDEPIEPRERRVTTANKDSGPANQTTTANVTTSCKTCGKDLCQCKDNKKENASSNSIASKPPGGDKPKMDHACGICMIGFANNVHLEEHNKTLHSKSPPRPYVCILCNDSFKAKTLLMEHVAKHAVINNFRCKVCSGFFPSKDDLDSHFRGHRIMKRTYSCRECKAVLKTRAACWDHLNLHLRGRSKAVGIPCEVCGRILSTRITLKEHMLIHSGEKPFECQLCGRKIRHRVNFLLHVQGHTLGLPHQCTTCGMSFNKKSELNLHVSNEHPEQKDYDCSICGIKFKTESRFLKHAVSHDAYLEE